MDREVADGEDMPRLRDYAASARTDLVRENYRKQHVCMTMDFVAQKHEQWLTFDHGQHTVREVVDMLDGLVDESDPDLDIPNSVHCFQTAERARAAMPEHDWLHLVALIHDLGKVMALWGEAQHCVVGDTFPVGCRFADGIVWSELFEGNPDLQHPGYQSPTGCYEAGCGLDNLRMCWGHDEYMYRVLRHNDCSLPEEGMSIIRYHSFYAWHSDGEYTHLTNAYDEEVLKPWVCAFNRFDLYSKQDAPPTKEECEAAWRTYYEPLCHKYGIGGIICW